MNDEFRRKIGALFGNFPRYPYRCRRVKLAEPTSYFQLDVPMKTRLDARSAAIFFICSRSKAKARGCRTSSPDDGAAPTTQSDLRISGF
jgi:hypothetical protein